MIGVKVGKENRFQMFQRQATQCRDLSRAGASINQIQRFTGENRDTCLSTTRGWQWGGGAAKKYLETLRLTKPCWALHRCSYRVLQKPVLPCAGVPDPDANRYGEDAKTSQKLDHVLHHRVISKGEFRSSGEGWGS